MLTFEEKIQYPGGEVRILRKNYARSMSPDDQAAYVFLSSTAMVLTT